MNGRILLAEDDDNLREVMTFNLREAGFDVDAVADGRAALDAFEPTRHEAVVTDLRMPRMDGMELLSALLGRDPDVIVVVVTAYGSTDRALEAMRRGAFHYVEKPVNNLALQTVIGKAVDQRRKLRGAGSAGSGTGRTRPTLVASSPAMNEVLRMVDKIASTDASILIEGESGTGKELVARAIHDRSARNGQFVPVNCAAIPADLLESVLFGHEKGAFTGAYKASEGKFVAAEGGTLFLDEVGEMSESLQSKLLRVLQEGEIDVVGSSRPRPVDARIVAATHQDLEELVQQHRFRQDLYFRLNVIPIEIPPLRNRREDIPVLFRVFLRKYAGGAKIAVAREVDEALLQYDFPGNVRELENIVERMVLLRDEDQIDVSSLPDTIRAAAAARANGALPFHLPDDGLDLMELERKVIIAALEKMGGNQSATARYLNIPRHVLLYRLEKFGIGPQDID